ncbi:MAG: exonuclease SbcCD subunit D C-terminal domain-containing protein [Ferruginibacter sp.]
MKILHTADWHIGQLFHEYDRNYEHQQFLNWLINTLGDEQVDVLLISGDVFDLSNPSAASIKMFYTFLNKAVGINPDLQIIITAGNHDSAARLESPKPLLESSNIHIIGLVERNEDGDINYEKLLIPLKNKFGVIKAWCLAIPFLRMGDYPVIAGAENPYAEGVTALYTAAHSYACGKRNTDQPVICMGHLHAQQSEISDMDKAERMIMGGIECISAAGFHSDIKYVALGHIHKAQRLAGKEYIRYCGSPIPMSFSELHYKHQVIVFDLIDENIEDIKTLEIPLSVALLRIPSVPGTLPEVLKALQQLPATTVNGQPAPYLEVRVIIDGPEPALRHIIESAVEGKNVRLATIKKLYKGETESTESTPFITQDKLEELKPQDVFFKLYESRYNTVVPADMLKLFTQAAQEAIQTDHA